MPGVLRTALLFLGLQGRCELSPLRPPPPPPLHRVVENVRHYSDGMHKLYTPSLFTRALAAVTLGLYIGVPHLLLCLLLASYWWRPAGWALLALLATLALPARPLRLQRVLSAYLFLAWRRYFTFSYLFEKSLDCYQVCRAPRFVRASCQPALSLSLLPACLPTCLPTGPPADRPTCLPACLP